MLKIHVFYIYTFNNFLIYSVCLILNLDCHSDSYLISKFSLFLIYDRIAAEELISLKSIFMYVINSFIEEVKKQINDAHTWLFYEANRCASSISKQMPFNLANIVVARLAAHLRTFTCALPNGIAIRGHVRGEETNDARVEGSDGGAACKSGSPDM